MTSPALQDERNNDFIEQKEHGRYNAQAEQAGYSTANTAGQGAAATVSAELQGLELGCGFLPSWIWGIGNSVWIALLAFIPFVNIIVPFYLLFKGNELAWRAKQWDSVEVVQGDPAQVGHCRTGASSFVGVVLGCVFGVIGGIAGSVAGNQ